jgi:GlpG protein
LPSKELAEQFRFFLHCQAIEVYHDPEGEDEPRDIWILSDEDLPAAQQYLEEFSRNPQDPRFKAEAEQGKKQFLADQKNQRVAEKAALRAERWQGNFVTNYPVTCMVIAVSVLFFAFGYLRSSFELTKFLLFSTSYGDHVLKEKSFHEILSGQVWRLFTPIFIHRGFFHIFFNLIWFYQFARYIENSLTSRKLLVLILAIAIPSNLAFYLVAGPAFGGLSGVNYGLFAYMWFRGNYSPNSPMRPDPQLAQFFFVWYLICLGLTLLGGLMGMKVANTIHGVGALMGIVMAVFDTQTLSHLYRSLQINSYMRRHALIGLGLLVLSFGVDYFSY